MKVNFFTAYGMMWKRTFDYKGVSGRKEFWFPFLWQCIFGTLTSFMVVVNLLVRIFIPDFRVITMIPLGLLVAYMVICIIPFSSLTVRRLEDAGKSGWLYLLVLLAGIGTVILLTLCAAGSVAFTPANNEPVAIYGPPDGWDTPFDPEDNRNADVYGPPDWDEPEEESFDPEDNMNDEVYGPPEMFEEFDSSLNENLCIYGPPEMIEERNEELMEEINDESDQ